MGRIPQPFINELVNQTNILDVIEKRISLKKAGHRYLAKCPFHDEKTPSFTVDAVKQFYYCFGCHAHGNVISFIMTYDKMEFVEAVENLAAKAGLQIPREAGNHEQFEKSKALTSLMHRASVAYQKALQKQPEALEYLKTRGLSQDTIDTFEIGFAPPVWDYLTKKLSTQPELIKKLTEVGMLTQKMGTNRYYDRFRHRIMFPIKNLRNQVIGFGGRTLDPNEPAKYLNSPETPIFHKGNELYNLNRLKKTEQLLVVEGYMDVISLYQHGIDFAVAPLGTAITKKQIQLLTRHTQQIIFCFDGDEAGKKAAWRALEISLPLMEDGLSFQFLFLPDGEDPDSFIQKKGKSIFLSEIKKSIPLADFFFQTLQKNIDFESLAGKAQFSKQAKHYLLQLPNGLFKTLMLEKLANLLQVSPEQLEEKFVEEKFIPQSEEKNKMPSAIRTAITLLVQYPEHALDEEINTELLNDFKKIDLAGLPVLRKILDAIKKTPTLKTGTLLECFRDDEKHHAYLARLASNQTTIPALNIKEELIGAFKQIHQQGIAQMINTLLNKAKADTLDDKEKKLLQDLIQYKVKK